MKKSIIVNINGIVFHIDEDAYEVLNHYISELKRHFMSQSGGKEIVDDIESRIVELLQPKISSNKQSITIEDIEDIISVLGKPEDIAGSEESASQSQTKSQPLSEKTPRRLYRDTENSVISGVCSGMAAYFNIDPVLIRILFFASIFAGGLGMIIYIILWISVPEAKTTSQRLEMRGEDITITNIGKKVREEKEFGKTSYSNSEKTYPSNKFIGFFHELIVAFGKFVITLFTAFKYIFAVLLIIAALCIIIGSISSLFFSNFVISNGIISNIGSVQEFLNYFLLSTNTSIILLLGLALVILPCVGFIYWGLKILIRFKANDKWVSLSMSVLWIVSFIIFISIVLSEVNRFKSQNTDSEITELIKPSKKLFYVQLINTKNRITEFSNEAYNNCLFGMEMKGNSKVLFAPVNIQFEKNTENKLFVKTICKAYGSDYEEAVDARKSIKLTFKQNDTILLLDPYFRIGAEQQWKFQKVKLIISIPDDYSVHYDKNINLFIHNWDSHFHAEFDFID